MANTILTPNQITRGMLAIFHNNLRFVRTVNRSYDNQYAANGAPKIGASLRIRIPPMYTVSTGAALSVQDTTEQYVTLTVGTAATNGTTSFGNQYHIDTNFTSEELTLSIEQLMMRVGEPAMSVLASNIDYAASAMWNGVINMVGTPGTTPGSARTLLDAHTKLNLWAVPGSPRYLAVEPNANAALVDALKGLFNPSGKIGDNYTEGTLANNQLGYRELYMTQSARNLTTGTHTAYQTNTPSGITNGATTLAVDGGTGSATIKAGEVFTIAGVNLVNPETKADTGQLYQFVVGSDFTGSSGAGNITLAQPLYKSGAYQNISADIPDNTALTYFDTSTSTTRQQSCAYYRDAFAIASADLVIPPNVESAREVMDGISMRYVRQYRVGTDDVPARFDVLIGGVVARPQGGCRITS